MSDIDREIEEIGAHTPGPWEVDRFKGQPPYLVTNRHDVICLFQRHERIREEDIEANARLIVLAPELLKELKACRERAKNLDSELKHWLNKYKEDSVKIERRTKEACREKVAEARKEGIESVVAIIEDAPIQIRHGVKDAIVTVGPLAELLEKANQLAKVQAIDNAKVEGGTP